MSNAWLTIPLQDYEGHMGPQGLGQLQLLTEVFQHILGLCKPQSVAILGIAGGNGLEHIDPGITSRIVGVDINRAYLNEVQNRFATMPGLELRCHDLAVTGLSLDPVALVHAALLFEHVGAGLTVALENALSLVQIGGHFSVVLQLPSQQEQGVASTKFTKMQALRQAFTLIDPDAFQESLTRKGFRLVEATTRSVPGGKDFWCGLFARSSSESANASAEAVD